MHRLSERPFVLSLSLGHEIQLLAGTFFIFMNLCKFLCPSLSLGHEI
nr:MAG TPA: hypothetical protein [Bacteriophage sp.]